MSLVYERKAQVLSPDTDVSRETIAEIASRIRTPRRKVVVLMHPCPIRVGRVYVIEGQVRTDVGTVVAAPETPLRLKQVRLGPTGNSQLFWQEVRERGRTLPYPAVGSTVLVHPSDGSEVKMDGRTYRVVGAFTPEQEWSPVYCDWWESIVAEVGDVMLKAFGDKIIVRLDEQSDRSQGGILIPDVAKTWQADADVLSVGRLIDDLGPGDRVSVDMNIVFAGGLEATMGKEYARQFVIPIEAVNFVYV